MRLYTIIKLLLPVVLVMLLNFGLRFSHQQGIERGLRQVIQIMASSGMNVSCDLIESKGIFGWKLTSEVQNCEVYLGSMGFNSRIHLPKVVLYTNLLDDQALIQLPQETEIAFVNNKNSGDAMVANMMDSFLVQLKLQNDRDIRIIFRETLLLGVWHGFDNIVSQIMFKLRDSTINSNEVIIVSLAEIDGDISLAKTIDIKNTTPISNEDLSTTKNTESGPGAKEVVVSHNTEVNNPTQDAIKFTPIHTKLSVKNVKFNQPQFFGRYAEYFQKIGNGNIVIDLAKNIDHQEEINQNTALPKQQFVKLKSLYQISNSGFASDLFNIKCDGIVKTNLLSEKDKTNDNNTETDDKLNIKLDIYNYDILISEMVKTLYEINNPKPDQTKLNSNITVSKFVFRHMFARDSMNASLHVIQGAGGEWKINGHSGEELSGKLGAVLVAQKAQGLVKNSTLK